MSIAVVICMLLASVAVHEAAHALALRGLGFRINQAGLGIPVAPVLRLPTPWGWTFTLSPWLFAAYVSTTDEDHDRVMELPYRQRAWYQNAGVVANVLLATGAVAVHALIHGRWLLFLIAIVVTAVVWVTRVYLAAYVFPWAALPSAGLCVWAIVHALSNGQVQSLGFSGLGTLGPATGNGVAAFLAEIPVLVAGMSASLAMLNLLPVFPLDNAKVIEDALADRLPDWAVTSYRYAGLGIVLILMALTIAAEVWAVVGAAWL